MENILRTKQRSDRLKTKSLLASLAQTCQVKMALFSHRQLQATATELAPRLIGHYLLALSPEGAVCGGRIVETEAYHQDDEASHSYCGITNRNRVMFEAGGIAYVYRSYGIHWCFNVVCGSKDVGEAVLIRALEPLWGIHIMQKRRGLHVKRPIELCNGPGKLCQALGITGEDNGQELSSQGPIILAKALEEKRPKIICSTRIGISKAVEKPWRFSLKDHPAVSRPRPPANCRVLSFKDP